MRSEAAPAAGESFIVAPQWIGDAVMTEPLLRRLHARGERLTVGAVPAVAPVYRAMPQVHQVIELPFQRGSIQLRARHALSRQLVGRFDTAYVLPNSLKSALLPLLAGIPKRVGYLGEARVGLLTHRLRNPGRSTRLPMVAFYSALAGESGVEQDRPNLKVAAAEVDQVLQVHQLQHGSYIVFAPGAEYGPAKRWPAERFVELGRSLQHPVVLLGSAKESELCGAIAAAVSAGANASTDASAPAAHGCIDLSGKTSLEQAFAWIAGAASVVSNDSGLMHVAAALGVRQIAIFGSSSPRHTPPLNNAAQVIWLKDDSTYQPSLDCAPCFERTCPLGHTRCLNDVSAERVLSVL
ncbi:MAG: lipopolysaccharide heptosyltransferase II [Burkholderiaceae bacterium]